MTAKMVEATWAWPEIISNPDHEEYMRELLSYDFLDPLSIQFQYDPGTFQVGMKWMPSAMSWSRKFEWPWALQKGALQWDHTVLNAGAGHSVFMYALAKRVKQVVNADSDDSEVERIFNGKLMKTFSNIAFQKDDIRKINFPDNFFDSTFCVSVLEHTESPIDCINELIRVTKKGRPILISMDVVAEGSTDEFHLSFKDAMNIVSEFKGQLHPCPQALCQKFDTSKIVCLCCKLIKN